MFIAEQTFTLLCCKRKTGSDKFFNRFKSHFVLKRSENLDIYSIALYKLGMLSLTYIDINVYDIFKAGFSMQR